MLRCSSLGFASMKIRPDNNFIIDRHPGHENVWLLGGGSGHGFKHGPALGEMVAGLVMEHKDPDALFRLRRFGK